MIGRTIGHYEVVEKLGSGGMGDVYRARDTKLGRDVAMKVLPDEFSRDESRRKRFMREAQAIAALKHPNIVTIHSVEEIDGATFITMELVEGDTLSKRIPKGGVPLDAFFEYAIPLADALSSAHDQGITHRDLKPANIMFDRDGRLKVLDFGLAKLLDRSGEAEGAETVVESGDTGIGQIMGTAAYMSPEQAEGKPIDHRSDIFSLGIVLYQMATGDRPFKGDTQISTISAILKDHPQHISEIKTELPRHVGRIVNHCLEKKPDRRFQSAKDIRNELDGLRKEVDSGELSATMTSGPVAAPAKATNWKPIAIGVGVVAVAAIAFMALRGGGGGGEVATAESESTPAPPRVPAADEKEMAVVLPFENLGPAEDAYFAAGMTEEISSRLSAVKSISVISSTSATQYDRTGKTMKQIGEDLGVDYVLEGSVRWAKSADGVGRVRITPKLIRVADDTQMWSQTYDRNTDDIFEVQTDIATQVVDQLGVKLESGEQQQIAEAPTDNMQAYKYYMQAKNYVDETGDFYKFDSEVVDLYQKAVELDPQFLDAWCELSVHHSNVYYGPMDKSDERLSAARLSLRRAEEIDPDHYLTRFARGSYYYYGFSNYDTALEEFLAATLENPSDATSRRAVAYIYRRQGKWAECLENLQAAARLDPRSDSVYRGLAATYRAMREIDLAIENYDRMFELNPAVSTRLIDLVFAYAAKGDLAGARKALEAQPGETELHHFAWTMLHVYERDYEAARKRIDAVEMGGVGTIFKLSMHAFLDYYGSGREDAAEPLATARAALEGALDQVPGNFELRRLLASVLAMQGEEESAIREAKLAVEQTEKDKFEGPENLQALAGIYALVGREDDAIDLLEQLLGMVYDESITTDVMKQDPVYDSLRDNPRFQALLKPSL